MIFYLSLIDNQEDKDKFEYIYTNYKYTMLYEAKHILKDEHMAEDAVHESFIKIIQIISKISLENCNKLRRFLVLIVRHKSIDMIRKNEKAKNVPIDDILDTNVELSDDVLDNVMSIQGVRRLMEIIAELDDIYRIPLELSILYRYSHKEISEILDLSENLIRIRVFRARQQVKKKYERENE
ncbi:MAG: RNA polymerase sigma factor [Sedimentibacter saalensis]|uniref:RNA polymerase sigma factor n=1 Tax=Sedimentibacter saalensis TaxID=130788 RepID=UPI002B220301|nr:RNA polymerase sigma factor [Sedimentibacter saalensis]MEA5093637.1 RNA polymerase sigma factor [Sedimentibacter saalensis]